jgi:predicted RecA/RadA family phage recombinase
MLAQYLGDDDEFQGTAAADLPSGSIVFDAMGRAGVVAGLAGVKTGQRYSATAEGRFRVKCKSSDTFSAGALVYWDESESEATSTSSGNLVIGRADAAKTSGQLTVDVLLNSAGKSFADT